MGPSGRTAASPGDAYALPWRESPPPIMAPAWAPLPLPLRCCAPRPLPLHPDAPARPPAQEVKATSTLGFKGTIYDLGAGWGSLAVPLARQHPKQRVVAVELSPLCCLVLRVWKLLFRLGNLRIMRDDFHEVPVADASAVVLYLNDSACKAINLKLERELPKGEGGPKTGHILHRPPGLPASRARGSAQLQQCGSPAQPSPT